MIEELNKYKPFINSQFFNKGPMSAFIWKNDENWSIEAVSSNIKDNFNYYPNQFLDKEILYRNIIHKDDLQTVIKEVTEAYKSKKDSIEHKPYRIKDGDNNYRWIKDTTTIVYNKNKNPIYFVGYILDVTENRRNLIKAQKHENELEKTLSFFKSHKLAMDQSSIVTKSDIKGIIIYANDNFCKMSGYKKDEVIGKPHNIVRHPDNPASIFQELWDTIQNKKVWKKVVKNRDKFGNDYWVDTTILPILDEKENIVEYIAVRHDVTQMIKQQNKLDSIANTDTLTGLGNRYKLTSDILKSKKPALAILNIDNFSQINDFYGHIVGDHIIKEFGDKINKNKCEKECMVYHLQGDEYVLFNSNISKDEFLHKIKRILKKLEDMKVVVQGEYLSFSFSLGISFESSKNILTTADMALKIARKENKTLIVYRDDISLTKEYQNNLKWSKKVKEALQEERIVPVFQAIVNNETGAWEKYESLVRLEDNSKLITPYFFLDISKQTKHYTSITKVMIEKSFEMFKDKELEFSLNLTIEDILNNEIQTFIFTILDFYNIGSRVVFEIVESESIENFDEVLKFINKIKSYGCKIAIDDFGTGYSNFEYLMKLNADFIKIDGSLIKDIDSNKNGQIVVSTIVDFAKKMGIKTIAEFVETKEILDIIKELGVDYSQGYFFSQPKKTISIKK